MPTFLELTGTDNPFDGFPDYPYEPSRLALGDLDGDGDLDLVEGWMTDVRYYQNTGTANVPGYAMQTGTANPFNGIAPIYIATPSLGDIDGDGDLDVVAGAVEGKLSLYLNTGTDKAPAFAEQTGTANPFSAFDFDARSPGMGYRLSAPSLGDIDGDGDLDLVVGYTGSFLLYFRNTGTAASPAYAQQTGADNPFDGIDSNTGSPSLSDVDGDGDLDLVLGVLYGNLNYYLNSGTATAPVYAEQTGADNPFSNLDLKLTTRIAPSLADFDGDGDLDLVVASKDTQPRYLQNQDKPLANAAPTTSSVTLAPIAEDGGTLEITQAILLSNAVDPEGDAMTVSNVAISQGGKGSLVNNGNGIWTYTPALNDDTSVGFSYTISDGANTVDGTATLDITPVNDAPTTTPVTLSPIQEDSGTLLITQALLLVNADDIDGPNPLQAVGLQIGTGSGSLSSPAPGTWLYTPAPNDDGEVSFKYGVTDGVVTVQGSASLDILPVNDPLLAVADTAQTTPGTAVTIAVLANDSDIDGGPLSVSAITQGSKGSVVIQPSGTAVRYTPNAGFVGFDSFTYTASDGAGDASVAAVRVLVPSYIATAGNDVPLGTANADFILAGDGHDRVLAYGGADYVDGGRGADTISGGLGADTLLGGDGADTFLTTAAELAGDSVDGGDGIDTLQITDSMAAMPAAFTLVSVEQLSFPGALQVAHTSLLDLSALTLSGTGNQIMGGTAASRITGTRSNDRITDSAGNDDLRGADGNDTIMAGVGQDTIHGGNGNDTLGGSSSTLGDGAIDTFVFNTPLNAATNVDTIIGFEANSRDLIALDSSIFSAIGAALEAGEFRAVAGGMAADANDFILYDTATGALYYDADGNGVGARVQFATLGAGLTGTVDAADFSVTGTP